MASFVLSVIGDDRSGLVEALSGAVTDHGGNWEKSHMTQLAGKFAGILLVSVPDARSAEFESALEPLEGMGLLDIAVERADALAARPRTAPLVFEIVGNDRPGIIHEVSHLLASLEVNIADLQTWTESAAMAGGILFHARAAVHLPEGLGADELVDRLEELAHDLMVDLITGDPVPD